MATEQKLQAYPNPFTKEVAIPVEWDGETDFTVRIFDVSGNVIRTLNMDHLSNQKEVIWDGANGAGSIVSKGNYFFQYQSGRNAASGKLIKE